jgi:hypothetical protein
MADAPGRPSSGQGCSNPNRFGPIGLGQTEPKAASPSMPHVGAYRNARLQNAINLHEALSVRTRVFRRFGDCPAIREQPPRRGLSTRKQKTVTQGQTAGQRVRWPEAPRSLWLFKGSGAESVSCRDGLQPWARRRHKRTQTAGREENGRAGEIRTLDLLHPMQARYQATLRPEQEKGQLDPRFGLKQEQIKHSCPLQPRAVQCSRPK